MNNIQTRAERNIAWIHKHLRVPEGQYVGNPIVMPPYMQEDFKAIYDNPAGTRTAIISRARKQAKTTLSAMIVLLHLCGPEASVNSQLYSAAQSRDQAAILFALAAKMVRLSPVLTEVVTVRDTAKQLYCQELGTLYKALSADAATAYGLSVKLVIHDELAQAGPASGRGAELYHALETSTGAQKDPLSIVISTQAASPTALLSVLIDDALTGADPKTVIRFNYAPDDLDTFSVEAIKAANPAWDYFLNQEEVLGMRDKAMRMSSFLPEYENLVLNRRVEARAPFISRKLWETCGSEVVDIFDGAVYGGLDLASVSDLTAKVYVSPIKKHPDDEIKWNVKPQFWLPDDNLLDKQREDKVPYLEWRDGVPKYLSTTPGPSIEYEWVAEQLFQDFKEMDIKKIAFDRYNFKFLRPWLLKVGFREQDVEKGGVFEEVGQGFQTFGPAIRNLESLILNGRVAHGNHPVLAWNVSNATIVSDPTGAKKLVKGNGATGKIDGLVALTMALFVAQSYIDTPKPQPKLIFI